jgi:uncharacterized protein (DUF58 family)
MALLDPALLARIGDLELAARTVVDGLRSGPHRSPFHGYSAEFSQYRHYRPGDDLKYVDWKLLARTDRLYTKQFRETTDVAATMVIDTSASMAFAGDASGTSLVSDVADPSDAAASGATRGREGSSGPRTADLSRAGSWHARPAGADGGRSGAGTSGAAISGGTVTKLQYATMAAAALAYVISTQGDGIGLLAVQDDKARALTYVAPRSGGTHLRGVIAALARLTARGAAAPDAGVRRATDLQRRRGLLLVFSDFYDREAETLAELRRAARMGHDVVVFQVVTRAELEFPYRDDVDFRDLESSRSLLTNAREIRSAYKDAFTAFLERWRTQTRAEGLDYTLLVTDLPLDEALRGFLLRRTAA